MVLILGKVQNTLTTWIAGQIPDFSHGLCQLRTPFIVSDSAQYMTLIQLYLVKLMTFQIIISYLCLYVYLTILDKVIVLQVSSISQSNILLFIKVFRTCITHMLSTLKVLITCLFCIVPYHDIGSDAQHQLHS